MATLSPGSKLSHFEVIEKLGQGGMGIVYKARDLRLGRVVAIKVLPESTASDPERQRRFEQEAKAASSLNHPNITTVYEIDCAEAGTFIAMEFVDGKTLDHIMSRKGLRVTETLKYAVQIADALAAAHGIGIVHRDLKPANIMVTSKGQIKVLDFGLAKLTQHPVDHGTPEATMTMQSNEGTIAGTAAYMSPEQAQAKPVDARSDIFSFGIVLYEMVTGRRPFAGDTKLSTLAAILTQEPAPARDVAGDLPPELDRIIGRCLRKDPARRFQHMSDLYVALEELRDESDSGRLPGPPAAAQARKRLWPWAAIAGIAAIGAIGMWLVKASATRPLDQKVVPLTTSAGFQDSPTFSPDGNQVAFMGTGDNADNADIYVKLVGEANALRLTSDPAIDQFPAWSPDGKRIAFERSGPHGGIYTISPLGGSEQKVTDFQAEGPMSWSPDGKWLAVANESGIYLVSQEGSEPRRLVSANPPVIPGSPAISRDGRSLAYGSCSGLLCHVLVQDLDAGYALIGKPHRITTVPIAQVQALVWSRDGASVICDGSLGGYGLHFLWRLHVRAVRAPQRIEIAGFGALSAAIAPAGDRLAFSRVLRNFDIWSYRVDGQMQPLIVSAMSDFNPQFSPDGTRIAFESDRSGDLGEIWVTAANGSSPTQLTNKLGRHEGTPRWSPDGHWIAFDSLEWDGKQHVYVVDAGGGRPRRLTTDAGSQAFSENVPNWSRDGKWIYFTSNRTGGYELWRVPFSGGEPERLTDNGGETAFESADGKTLFYTKWDAAPLFAKPVSGGPEREVLPWIAARAFEPVQDGIYYIGKRGDDRKFPLEFFQFSTNTSRVLTKFEGMLNLGLAVSPDRQIILFSQSVSSGSNLMMIDNFQ